MLRPTRLNVVSFAMRMTSSARCSSFSKWLVRQIRLVHHVTMAMMLSITAPLVEYASRNGSLMASTNSWKLAGDRRDSSSRGKAVANLQLGVALGGLCGVSSRHRRRAWTHWQMSPSDQSRSMRTISFGRSRPTTPVGGWP